MFYLCNIEQFTSLLICKVRKWYYKYFLKETSSFDILKFYDGEKDQNY